MIQLTVWQLKCIATEDWGADECLLEVILDGVPQPPLRRSQNDGQTWTVDTAYAFRDRAQVVLWDEDSPDPNDWLGTATIGGEAANDAVASFLRDGAHYELSYSVAPDAAPGPGPADRVGQAIDEFAASGAPGVWPGIPKAELIADVRNTVANPYNVDQQKTPLCGPAAIVFELVSRNPMYFVSICRQLFEAGQFTTLSGRVVRPSDTLKSSRSPRPVSAADWLVQATLRDAENAIFPVEPTSGPIAMGITTPWEMKGWTGELLGFSDVKFESTLFYGEFEAMRKAQEARAAGGVAFLLIHGALLDNPAPFVGHPNHWISFLGNLIITPGTWWRWDSGQISFDCYSWGRRHSVNAREGKFEDYFFGVVTGR